MSMFDNYQNLDENYSPDNRIMELPYNKVYYKGELPNVEFNIKGEFLGYSWNYGDTLTIPVSLNPVVVVESDAYVYFTEGMHPDTNTEGNYNQKAYNVEELKSWTCKSIGQTVYKWEEDEFFCLPDIQYAELMGDCKNEKYKRVMIPTFDFGKSDYTAKVIISNFEHRNIVEFETKAENTIHILIDKEISDKMIKGNYSCTVQISSETSSAVYYKIPLMVK